VGLHVGVCCCWRLLPLRAACTVLSVRVHSTHSLGSLLAGSFGSCVLAHMLSSRREGHKTFTWKRPPCGSFLLVVCCIGCWHCADREAVEQCCMSSCFCMLSSLSH
jgi:hypothetical protein